MTAAELAKAFAAIYAPQPTDDEEEEAERPRRRKRRPKPADLHDRTNLNRFLLMERFADYPHVKLFSAPAEEWPPERIADFTTLSLAKREAQRVQDKRSRRKMEGDIAIQMMNEAAQRAWPSRRPG